MTKIVSEVEFIFDYQWTKANIFNDYLNDVALIGFYENETPCGLAVVKKQYKLLEIVEIYCKEKEIHKILHCYSELLDKVVEMLASPEMPILFSVSVDCEYFEQIDALLSDKGFKRDADKRVILSRTDSDTEKRWLGFLERRGNKIVDRMVRRGFVTVSYKDMTDLQKKNTHFSAGNEFEYKIDLEHLRMPIDGENSFFTFLNERLISYCVVFRLSPIQLIFEFMIVKKEFARSGVFLLPLVSFIGNAFTYEQTQNVVYVYRAENRDMDVLSDRMLSIITHSTKTRAYYMLRTDIDEVK